MGAVSCVPADSGLLTLQSPPLEWRRPAQTEGGEVPEEVTRFRLGVGGQDTILFQKVPWLSTLLLVMHQLDSCHGGFPGDALHYAESETFATLKKRQP